MKKKLFNFLMAIVCIFCAVVQANATITSEYDLEFKKNQLQTIAQYDYMSMVSKNELIGYRLDGFNMSTSQYKNSAMLAVEKFNTSLSQIESIKSSADLSDTDKQVQINNLYQDADATLYDIDAKTITYLFSLRNTMPTLSYDRYIKKFQEFYNSFHLTNSEVNVK